MLAGACTQHGTVLGLTTGWGLKDLLVGDVRVAVSWLPDLGYSFLGALASEWALFLLLLLWGGLDALRGLW